MAKTKTTTSFAPAALSVSAHARTVFPVVSTSSTSSTRKLARSAVARKAPSKLLCLALLVKVCCGSVFLTRTRSSR